MAMTYHPHLTSWPLAIDHVANIMERLDFSDHTIKSYGLWFKEFREFIAVEKPLDVTPEHVEEFQDYLRLERGNTPRTINAKVTGVMTHMRHLSLLGGWTPTLAKVTKKLPRPIDDDDIALLLGRTKHPMHGFIILGAFAGLRVSEMVALTPETETASSLIIIDSKGDDRRVPKGPEVRKYLREHPLPWLSPMRGKGAYSAAYVSIEMSKIMKYHGVNNTAHGLRHRFATALLAETDNIALVAKLLGHRSVETTMIYAEVSDSRKTEAVEAITLGAHIL